MEISKMFKPDLPFSGPSGVSSKIYMKNEFGALVNSYRKIKSFRFWTWYNFSGTAVRPVGVGESGNIFAVVDGPYNYGCFERNVLLSKPNDHDGKCRWPAVRTGSLVSSPGRRGDFEKNTRFTAPTGYRPTFASTADPRRHGRRPLSVRETNTVAGSVSAVSRTTSPPGRVQHVRTSLCERDPRSGPPEQPLDTER